MGPFQEILSHMIEIQHDCESDFEETIHVVATEQGSKVIWDGYVEVFNLERPPGVSKAYCWAYIDNNCDVQYVVVLGDKTVTTPELAVKKGIAAGHINPPLGGNL